MGQRVIRVAKLVEDDALAFVAHFVGDVARQFHAAILRRQHQFGTESAHALAAFDALVLRHDQDHPVTLDRRRHGQRDAGIAGGRLDQRIAGLDVAARFGMDDHRQRRPILDRTGRVVAFQLGEDDVVATPFISAPGIRTRRTSGVFPTKSCRVLYILIEPLDVLGDALLNRGHRRSVTSSAQARQIGLREALVLALQRLGEGDVFEQALSKQFQRH
jgi:hypothetical protein